MTLTQLLDALNGWTGLLTLVPFALAVRLIDYAIGRVGAGWGR